jgi:hypothetical protein
MDELEAHYQGPIIRVLVLKEGSTAEIASNVVRTIKDRTTTQVLGTEYKEDRWRVTVGFSCENELILFRRLVETIKVFGREGE